MPPTRTNVSPARQGAGLALTLLCLPALSQAQTVHRPTDTTALYAALSQAESSGGEHYIYLSPSSDGVTPRYKLDAARGPLRVRSANVYLIGNETTPGKYMIDGQAKTRVLDVRNTADHWPYVELRGVTLQNGKMTGITDGGGGMLVHGGDVYVTHSIVRKNAVAGMGVGIYIYGGSLTLDYTLVEGNVGNNVTSGSCGDGGFTAGGGVMAASASTSLTILNSTIKDNKQCRWGGVAVLDGASAWIENSTFTGNEGKSYGGGLLLSGAGDVTVRFNTFTNNKVGTKNSSERYYGAGIAVAENYTGQLRLYGNIIARNWNYKGNPSTTTPSQDDFTVNLWTGTRAYSVSDHGNLIGAYSQYGSLGLGGSFIGTPSSPLHPRLGSLASNGPSGGFQLPTHMPTDVSRALNNFQQFWEYGFDCPGYDQRYYTRDASDGRCDIGAVERYATY